MGKLEEDVELDSEDMELFVEPLREVMVAFGDALFTTVHEAMKPHGAASKGRPKAYKRWEKVADSVARFMKVVDA